MQDYKSGKTSAPDRVPEAKVKQSLSRGELVVLGLLAEGDRHAYELSKIIEQRDLRSWARVSFPSLYRVARALDGRGLVVSHSEGEAGRPTRRVLALTPAGREALEECVLEILAAVPGERTLTWLALMFAASLPLDQVRAALDRFSLNAEKRLAEQAARRKSVAQRFSHPLTDAIFSHERSLLQAELRWARKLCARLGE